MQVTTSVRAWSSTISFNLGLPDYPQKIPGRESTDVSGSRAFMFVPYFSNPAGDSQLFSLLNTMTALFV